jgi:hypothetical protein
VRCFLAKQGRQEFCRASEEGALPSRTSLGRPGQRLVIVALAPDSYPEKARMAYFARLLLPGTAIGVARHTLDHPASLISRAFVAWAARGNRVRSRRAARGLVVRMLPPPFFKASSRLSIDSSASQKWHCRSLTGQYFDASTGVYLLDSRGRSEAAPTGIGLLHACPAGAAKAGDAGVEPCPEHLGHLGSLCASVEECGVSHLAGKWVNL